MKSMSYRRPGKRLCEFTRLAVDIEPRFNSKDFLARLIHVAVVYAHLIQHATDMLIEVNPRHVGFYRRSLGFNQIGPERICSRVNAPAVLMHIDLHHMATQIRVHGGGNRHGAERTLYPHFLSGAEQRVLLERMRHYLHHLQSGGDAVAAPFGARIFQSTTPVGGSACSPSRLERRVRSRRSKRDPPGPKRPAAPWVRLLGDHRASEYCCHPARPLRCE